MIGNPVKKVKMHISSSMTPFNIIPFDMYQNGPKKNAGQCQPPLSSAHIMILSYSDFEKNIGGYGVKIDKKILILI
jgi:hypothetical protein